MRSLIVHVAPFLWSGAGSVITRLCVHQARTRPVLLTTSSRADGLRDWPAYRARLRRAGVEHLTLDGFHRDPPRFWRSVAQLAAVLGERRPAVVHAHAGVPTALAAIARDVAGVRPRLVGQMYSWGPDRPRWMDQQDLWAFGQADVSVCSAHHYAALLRRGEVPRRRLVYLPWGLPLETLPWHPRSPRERTDAPVLGFVGRVEPRKGQLALVEAFAQVRRAFPAATLELAGPIADRHYAAEVRRAIRRHRLGTTVRLLGLVPDVPAVLRRWDLFVSLSEDEGQGLAVLEAMASGVPVAARPVAGIEDFLTDGRTGWAIDGASPRTAATVLRRALTEQRQGAAIAVRARRLVERRYDWDRMVSAFDRLYGVS